MLDNHEYLKYHRRMLETFERKLRSNPGQASSRMKTFTTLLFMLLASAVLAQPPTYDYTRKTVVEQNPKNVIPEAEQLFVSDNYQNGIIVRFRDGITLRDIIDQTKHKNKECPVVVLRSSDRLPVYSFMGSVKPSDKPTFSLKPGDVVLLGVDAW
jgi:hypothetical protein